MKKKYLKVEDNTLIIWCTGICFLLQGNVIYTDLLVIADKVLHEQINFNELYGFYKIAIYNKQDNSWLLFGDNAGSQFWIIDYEKKIFSDRLLSIRDQRKGNILPNYDAVLQMCSEGYILTEDTLIKNVSRTSSEYYYLIVRNNIQKKSKKLSAFSRSKGMDLKQLMEILCKNISQSQVACVCTGGTDSRVVLAHLIRNHVTPRLIITGHEDNPDVKISQEIAEILHLPLEIQDPFLKEQDWIEKGFQFCDGMSDVVDAYRHFKKKTWAVDQGLFYEFGGVGGEYYKNHFFHFFHWRGLWPTYNKAYELLCKDLVSVPLWGGENLKKSQFETEVKVKKIVKSHYEGRVYDAFNEVGMMILQSKAGVLTNQFAPEVIKLDPLTEREVIARGIKGTARSHQMHQWQRKEIYNACPKLCNIKTDRGYSCSLNPWVLFIERIHMLTFYCGRVFQRVKQKLGMNFKSSQATYWNRDYEEARNSGEFEQALEVCKQLKIIEKHITKKEIPINKVGIILCIGIMFRDNI